MNEIGLTWVDLNHNQKKYSDVFPFLAVGRNFPPTGEWSSNAKNRWSYPTESLCVVVKLTVQRDFVTFPSLERHDYQWFQFCFRIFVELSTFEISKIQFLAVHDNGSQELILLGKPYFLHLQNFPVGQFNICIVDFLLRCSLKSRGNPSNVLKWTPRFQKWLSAIKEACGVPHIK